MVVNVDDEVCSAPVDSHEKLSLGCEEICAALRCIGSIGEKHVWYKLGYNGLCPWYRICCEIASWTRWKRQKMSKMSYLKRFGGLQIVGYWVLSLTGAYAKRKGGEDLRLYFSP